MNLFNVNANWRNGKKGLTKDLNMDILAISGQHAEGMFKNVFVPDCACNLRIASSKYQNTIQVPGGRVLRLYRVIGTWKIEKSKNVFAVQTSKEYMYGENVSQVQNKFKDKHVPECAASVEFNTMLVEKAW